MSLITSVIMARTWAIYERNRILLCVMAISFPLAYLPSFYLSFSALPKPLPQSDYNQLGAIFMFQDIIAQSASLQGEDITWILTRCYLPGLPHTMLWIFVTCLIYESIMFSAMCYRIRRDARAKSAIVDRLFQDQGNHIVNGRHPGEVKIVPFAGLTAGGVSSVSTVIAFAPGGRGEAASGDRVWEDVELSVINIEVREDDWTDGPQPRRRSFIDRADGVGQRRSFGPMLRGQPIEAIREALELDSKSQSGKLSLEISQVSLPLSARENDTCGRLSPIRWWMRGDEAHISRSSISALPREN
ncbi:hypothetical protein FRB99_008345 [Tulasnella sp. 403]|nr:hypothetical protein FRB99_008345 [Tulasnella sp. 403]